MHLASALGRYPTSGFMNGWHRCHALPRLPSRLQKQSDISPAAETALKGAPAPFSLVIFDLWEIDRADREAVENTLLMGLLTASFHTSPPTIASSSVAASIPVSHAGRLRLKPMRLPTNKLP